MSVEHRTHTRPPSDCPRGACRSTGCPGYPRGDGRNHGIASETVTMVAVGQHHTGPIAVNFTYATGRYHDLTPRDHWGEPMSYDLGHHSTVALYGGVYRAGACNWLDGAECFYDGSGLQADAYLNALNRSGEALVWKMLDDYLTEFSDRLTVAIREIGGVLR